MIRLARWQDRGEIMNWRWIIVAGLAGAGVICASLWLRPANREQKALEETRRALRQQGFKIDLSEFNFSAGSELRERAVALSASRQGRLTPRPSRGAIDLMAEVGSDSAMVVWKQDDLPGDSGEDLWAALRENINEQEAELDAACVAALSGPFRFNLNASAGSGMLLPHLAALRNLSQTLGMRVALCLHEADKDAAWTNLLATTRLVTAWRLEDVEISHLVRGACAGSVFDATWQALQAEGWSDDRLAEFQREWESVDFFKGLPETEAFTLASMAAQYQLDRRQPFSMGMTFKEMFHAPRYAWSNVKEYWRQRNYRLHGSYEDEKALLLYYRDHELQLRRAVQSPTWLEMQQLPGITNQIPFFSKHPSRVQVAMNFRRMSLAFQGGGQGFCARMAEAEARRRLIITAIALERYRGRHGSYPKSVNDLAPEFIKRPPVDFMDGKPLRYRLTDDGHFVLYSIGLDGVDDGGKMPSSDQRRMPGGFGGRIGITQAADLVWPRPASDTEVRAQTERKQEEEKLHRENFEKTREDERREREIARRAAVERLLAEMRTKKTAPPSSENGGSGPNFKGQPLSKFLRDKKVSGNNHATIGEMLTLKRITTGQEPDIATFEVPLRYDAMTNVIEYRLNLLVDGGLDESFVGRGGAEGCTRATNGNCLLTWNTTYDPPGQHVVQAELRCMETDRDAVKVKGPIAPFFSTNICQFDSAYDHFDDKGATLYARLPESNGIYTIELKSPDGKHVKTLKGSTSNGVINVHWDLKDEHGNRYTNDSLETQFNVTLPDSGRSQTMQGP